MVVFLLCLFLPPDSFHLGPRNPFEGRNRWLDSGSDPRLVCTSRQRRRSKRVQGCASDRRPERLSRVTLGENVRKSLRRVSLITLPRKSAHAGRDWLVRTPLPLKPPDSNLVRWLAEAFVAGPLTLESLVERGTRAVAKSGGWLNPLALRLIAEFGDQQRPATAQSRSIPQSGQGIADASIAGGGSAPLIDRTPPPVMWPARWDVPPLTTPAALANFLDLTLGELDWFADRQGRLRKLADSPRITLSRRLAAQVEWQRPLAGSAETAFESVATPCARRNPRVGFRRTTPRTAFREAARSAPSPRLTWAVASC